MSARARVRTGNSSNRNVNVNNNSNRNVNVNSNVNVNRNVNVDVDVNHRGGYYGGCCYHEPHPVATVAAVAVTAAVVGSMVNTLPPSCTSVVVNGFAYQQCGSTWYQPQLSGSSTTMWSSIRHAEGARLSHRAEMAQGPMDTGSPRALLCNAPCDSSALPGNPVDDILEIDDLREAKLRVACRQHGMDSRRRSSWVE